MKPLFPTPPQAWSDGRSRLPAGAIFGAILAAFIVSGCASTTRYTRGPQPVVATPEPTWAMTSPAQAIEEFESSPAVQIKGRLDRVRRINGDGPGLEISLRDVEFGFGDKVPSATFTVMTWTDAMPDMTRDDQVSVVMTKRYPRELIVSDSRGPAIRAFSGEVLPPIDGTNPLHVTALPENAYSEVILSPLLCSQTWIHSKIAVTSDETRLVFKPGQTAAISGSHAGNATSWLVTTADSAFLDESSCPEDIAPTSFFVWMRTATMGKATGGAFKKIRK